MKVKRNALRIFLVVFLLGHFSWFSLTYAKLAAPREPGRWSFSYQAFGNIPTNRRVREHFKSGLGVGIRGGYGFGKGLSVDAEFQYDLLFKEGGTNKIKENKNLFSLAPGLKYTVDFAHDDISGYLLGLAGMTFDYTKSVVSEANLSYAFGGGVDFGVTENLSIGPHVKYRNVISDENQDSDTKMDIHLVSLGVAITYLYD